MSSKTFLRSFALFLAAFSFYSLRVAAQDDAPSVAEAARRARQQKQEAAKPAHIIDNDSLPPSPTPTNPSRSSSPATNSDSAAVAENPPTSANEEEQTKKEMDDLRQQIANKKSRIDFQQRELALAQDTYYSNPNHDGDKAGKDKLDSMRADLDQAKADLADLQAKLDKLASSAAPCDSSSKPSEPAPANP
jgi:DNA repair exonuclease SbcCD ATPase subunit